MERSAPMARSTRSKAPSSSWPAFRSLKIRYHTCRCPTPFASVGIPAAELGSCPLATRGSAGPRRRVTQTAVLGIYATICKRDRHAPAISVGGHSVLLFEGLFLFRREL